MKIQNGVNTVECKNIYQMLRIFPSVIVLVLLMVDIYLNIDLGW